MPGSEVHAQLLENVLDQSWLMRPGWAAMAEAIAFAVLGLLLVHATPRWRPVYTALLAVACVVSLLVAGFGAFAWRHLVFDAAVPSLGLVLLFGVLLLLTLAEATRQRKVLERVVQRQRDRRPRTSRASSARPSASRPASCRARMRSRAIRASRLRRG